MANSLPSIAEASKSTSTVKSYHSANKRFSVWCSEHDLIPLPASVTTIAIYLSYLIQKEVSKSVFLNSFYAIKWEHDLNLYNSVFSDPFLKLILEGGIRTLSRPVTKKQPITADILRKVVEKYGSSNSLNDLRLCCLMLIGYAGFLRYNELANIRFSNLQFFTLHFISTLFTLKKNLYR